MRTTRDLALIILFATISFVYGAAATPFTIILAVIPGAIHLFGIGHSIIISLALLMYEGRRWRFFLQGLLVMFLFVPTTAGGFAFDVLSKSPIIFSSFLADLIFNSVYRPFKDRKKLIHWTVLASISFFFLDAVFRYPIWSLLYSSTVMSVFVEGLLFMLPVIIIEWTFGGVIGHKIHKRVRNLR